MNGVRWEVAPRGRSHCVRNIWSHEVASHTDYQLVHDSVRCTSYHPPRNLTALDSSEWNILHENRIGHFIKPASIKVSWGIVEVTFARLVTCPVVMYHISPSFPRGTSLLNSSHIQSHLSDLQPKTHSVIDVHTSIKWNTQSAWISQAFLTLRFFNQAFECPRHEQTWSLLQPVHPLVQPNYYMHGMTTTAHWKA